MFSYWWFNTKKEYIFQGEIMNLNFYEIVSSFLFLSRKIKFRDIKWDFVEMSFYNDGVCLILYSKEIMILTNY